MPADDDFDDRCRRLYRSLRDGSVNREASFDLSADILLDVPADEEAAKVAELAIDEDADPALLAAAVRALLTDRFEPTFDDEPGWFAALEDALEIVKADLRASGHDAVISGGHATFTGTPGQIADTCVWLSRS